MEQKNFLKEKLKTGRAVLGLWNIIPSAAICEAIGIQGFDFQILDLEHGMFDVSSLEACARACELTGSSPLVRVHGPDDHSSIQSALDLGVHGIIVPQVKDSVCATQALSSTLFAPKGRRGFNPFTRAGKYLPSGSLAPGLTDDFSLRSVIVETQTAYDDLDRILSIPELDIVYLGVYDMSVALGCRGDFDHPLIQNFLKTSIPRIRAAGKSAGVMAKTSAEIATFVKLGVNFIVAGVDTQMIATSAQAMRKIFDQTVGGLA
jgi:4-hydroxy-2-oxoheptanedioate aldolase